MMSVRINLVHLFCVWKLVVLSLPMRGIVRSVDCPVWLFLVEVAGEEAVWILVIPCMSGTEGCDRRGVPGRYLRRVTDSSARPVMYQHRHDSANEGKASEAHLSASPCSVSLTVFVYVVSTHQHFKWWEACGNGKAKHAYWVNEARSEASLSSPFLQYKKRRKHHWQKWIEWERASTEGETFGTTSRTHRLSRTKEAEWLSTNSNTTAVQAGFRSEPEVVTEARNITSPSDRHKRACVLFAVSCCLLASAVVVVVVCMTVDLLSVRGTEARKHSHTVSHTNWTNEEPSSRDPSQAGKEGTIAQPPLPPPPLRQGPPGAIKQQAQPTIEGGLGWGHPPTATGTYTSPASMMSLCHVGDYPKMQMPMQMPGLPSQVYPGHTTFEGSAPHHIFP